MIKNYDLTDIEDVAREFIEFIQGFKIICFHGNLGAGKTTFIQEICSQLGVKEKVTSPTFSIINEYRTLSTKTIFHIDLYRVKDNEEALNAGVEECIYSDDTCFIEWPEKVTFLPSQVINVYLDAVSDTNRRITCKLPT